MNTVKTLQIKSISSEETEQIGEQIGRQLRGGEVIQLSSDVGGGKTTLVRGMARGAGSSDHVSSPTFTICNQYEAKNFTIFHYDFYRLGEAGLIKHELSDDIGSSDTVCIIEWADIIADVLPVDAVVIEIASTSESERTLKVTAKSKHKEILKDLE